MTLEEAIQEEYKNQSTKRFGLKAFSLGFIASKEGRSKLSCPYTDLRTDRGNITFSRAYRRRWIRGYEAHEKSKNKPETPAK